MANTDLMIMTDKKFETSSKDLNKELNAILDAMKKALRLASLSHSTCWQSERLNSGRTRTVSLI